MKYWEYYGENITYDEYVKLQATEIGNEREQELNRKLAEMEANHINNVYVDKNANILDVGCADGYFMDIIKKKGFKNVYGLDLIKEKADRAAKFGHNVYIGDIENFEVGMKFGVINCSHMLEHTRNPLNALKKMSFLLAEQGIILLVVPIEHHLTEGGKHLHYWDTMNELLKDIDDAGMFILSAFLKRGLQYEYWITCGRSHL